MQLKGISIGQQCWTLKKIENLPSSSINSISVLLTTSTLIPEEGMVLKVYECFKGLSPQPAKTAEGTALISKNAIWFGAAGPTTPKGKTL